MLADPLVVNQVITTAATLGTPVGHPRAGNDRDTSSYRLFDADNNDWRLSASHQYGRTRNRFNFRVDVSGLMTSLTVPAEKTSFSQSCYVVFDCPNTGPIANTATVTLIDRKMCYYIGQQLLGAAGADPTFLASIVKSGQL
jgi:hypothetical protein